MVIRKGKGKRMIGGMKEMLKDSRQLIQGFDNCYVVSYLSKSYIGSISKVLSGDLICLISADTYDTG